MTTETGRPGQSSPLAAPPTPGPQARCELTELFVSQCAHCTGAEKTAWLVRLRAGLLARRGWIAAMFPGRCCECGEPFAPGAAIRARPGHPFGDGHRYLAECCAEDPDD